MFSKATEYALRATIYIAQKGKDEQKLGIEEIAKAIDSPKSFTAKIMQSLTRGNTLISSVRGPGGGFYITEKARNLPVRAVIRAMGEDEVLTRCVMGLKQCSERTPCPMHAQYRVIKNQLIELFETKTIRDVAEDLRLGNLFINNRKVGKNS